MVQPEQEKLKQALLAEARRLGFMLAGVTTAEPPESFQRFAAWVQAGRHADMGYLALERNLTRRADLRAILPECRSVLVLGIPYQPAGDARGGLAAYAQGDDYHDVLVPRLAALVDFLEKRIGEPVPSRWYTDTGPVLERDLARRAGLGWIGKNSMLIHPQAGSYFLLAEILLGIDLLPDAQFESDHCGSCTRCLEACPTACIRPDRTLDAGRCISYLTIENKGEIPADLRGLMGEWQFGCDVCQQVCPWNRFAPDEIDPALRPRPAHPPVDTLRLTPETFSRRYQGSPIKRAKRRGLLRNTAVALGNRGEEGAGAALAAALQDDEPLVRGHAAWALGQIGGQTGRRALEKAEGEEGDDWVRGEIRRALTSDAGEEP
jgi:epoxyqueuosine reductase